MHEEKLISYQSQSSYSKLNNLTDKTDTIWMVFHGMGYLSKYFIRYFRDLDPEKNFIIAPQAPSKYYQDSSFKHVGACWLTRVDTQNEMENIINYINAIWDAEVADQLKGKRLIVLGYSQGVSIASRWVSRMKIACDKLVLHSGGIPKELRAQDFEFLPEDTEVLYLYGDQDEYINEARKTEEQLKASQLFGHRTQVKVFPGKHEVYKPILKEL